MRINLEYNLLMSSVDIVFMCVPGDASVSGHDEYR